MHKGRIVRTSSELRSFLSLLDITKPIAADTETYKQRPTQPLARLLGLSLTGYSLIKDPSEIGYGLISAYVVFSHFNKIRKLFEISEVNTSLLREFILRAKLVGWNVPFDKTWIDSALQVDSKWLADGRIIWHLQNNDFSIRGFGLKLAQKKLLGWEDGNDKALEEHVAMVGGKLANGDHYLADVDILSHYACLDTYSTLKCYETLEPFMVKHDYMGFHDDILQFAINLSKASSQGIPVNEAELFHAAALYEHKRDEAKNEIRNVCGVEITAMEDKWKVQKAASYKRPINREGFFRRPHMWRNFNPSSGPQRETLIHTMLEFPIRETTPTGRAKTDRANLSLVPHPGAKCLINYSEYKKVAEQARTYLGYVQDGRLYTNYDVCGTVSGRLSGFKPSVLNMPFSEPEVMSAFKSDPGYVGIHADLAAIEPCVLAHYSGDPGLLKVYRDGLGDVYLDLGLDIFPDRADLKQEYNPNEPVKSEIKEKFKDLRAVCKIIHLAVSYTGTHVTVSKNLSKAGYFTGKGEAMRLVARYWRKFFQVKAFNIRLQEVYEPKGFIRNLVGRVIQVPDIYKKDLMNRLVQSSAHDLLRLWVDEIINQFTLYEVNWRWWLPDLHDSTTFMVKEGQEEIARRCYLDALKLVEHKVGMTIPIKCELKFNKTLAGIKSNEL